MYMHSNFKAGILQISKKTLGITVSSWKQLIFKNNAIFTKLGGQTLSNLHNMCLALHHLI